MFPPNFPQEIVEMIILETKNVFLSIFLESSYAFRCLFSEKDTMEILNILMSIGAIKQLYWLHKMKFISTDDIFQRLFIVADKDTFHKVIRVIPLPKTTISLESMFQASIKSCCTWKIRFLISYGEKHGYKPDTINDVRALRHCPNVMNFLMGALDPQVIFTADASVVALESNNVEYLETANRLFDVRYGIKNRDLMVAAHRGAIDALKWYHHTCPCKVTNYSHCILDECIYKAALMSHQEAIVRWLKEETNCLMFRLGYPLLGWLNGFGGGDILGARLWFQR